MDTLLIRRAPERKGWPLYLPGQAPRWSAKREPTRGEYVAPGRHLNLTSVASFVDKDRAPSDNPRSRTVRSRAPRNPPAVRKFRSGALNSIAVATRRYHCKRANMLRGCMRCAPPLKGIRSGSAVRTPHKKGQLPCRQNLQRASHCRQMYVFRPPYVSWKSPCCQATACRERGRSAIRIWNIRLRI